MRFPRVGAVSLIAALVSGCTAQQLGPYGEVLTPDGKVWGLKEAFEGTFKVGVSFVRHKQLFKDPESSLIKNNFDVLVPETDMIWSEVEQWEDDYDFSFVDEYLDWCEANNIEPIGHCLIWKGIGWMSYHKTEGLSEEELRKLYLTRMEDYIKTMLTRYKDRVRRWIVVNEWFTTSGQIRRDFEIPKALGLEGLEMAYRWAMQYGGPNNVYYHSEHLLWNMTKTRSVISALDDLRAKGVQIDGIMFQGHQPWSSGPFEDVLDGSPGFAAEIPMYDEAIKYIGRAGYPIVLSELDIYAAPYAWNCCRNTSLSDYSKAEQRKLNPWTDGLPKEVAEEQRAKWVNMFKMLLDNKEYVTDVHMWSLSDESIMASIGFLFAQSWYNKWPIRTRKDYPTLFDRKHEPKPHFYDILRIAPNQPPEGTYIPDLPTATK